jgi:hypothetical protein
MGKPDATKRDLVAEAWAAKQFGEGKLSASPLIPRSRFALPTVR